MFYYTRSKKLFYYRLFFIVLFLLLGISGIGIVVLDYYAGIELIAVESYADRQALFATACAMGILSFSTALIMVYLMREKRSTRTDRRIMDRPLDFPDRRSNIDRRSQTDQQVQAFD